MVKFRAFGLSGRLGDAMVFEFVECRPLLNKLLPLIVNILGILILRPLKGGGFLARGLWFLGIHDARLL